MIAIAETPLFFPGAGYSLFGVFHEPVGSPTGEAFVFCHPFGEEKLWTHRVLVSFARLLAERGHAVLRFDYMGNGDSHGTFQASSLGTMISDVRAAVRQASSLAGTTRISLLGLRLGASIACLAADELPEVPHLVLWAPIVDGARYMQELLRSNVATQMATYNEVRLDRNALVELMRQGQTVNVDGYEMALPMYDEVSAVALRSGPRRHPSPLIVQIDRRPGNPSAETQQFAATFEAPTVLAVAEEPFWKEIPQFYQRAPNLFGATLGWLERS